jgi:hypothetical protein
MKRLFLSILFIIVFMPSVLAVNELVWNGNLTGVQADASAGNFVMRSVLFQNGTVLDANNISIYFRSKAGSTYTTVSYVYIAEMPAGDIKVATKPKNITFSGNPTFTIADGTLKSDWLLYNFTKGKNYSITVLIDGSNGNPKSLVGGVTMAYGSNSGAAGKLAILDWSGETVNTYTQTYSGMVSVVAGTNVTYAGEAPPAADTGNIDILFNTSYAGYNTVFCEGDDINIWVNYTNATGGQALNGSCNITTYGSHIEKTLFSYDESSAGDSPNNNISFASAGNLDFAHFKVCQKVVATDSLNVTFLCDGKSFDTIIPTTQIIKCNANTTYTNVTAYNSNCTTNTTLNISFRSNVLAIKAFQIKDADLDRRYAATTVSTTFGTNGLYYPATQYEYYIHGIKTIDANCSYSVASLNKTASETITICNSPPKILFDSFDIDGVYFNNTNNTKYEFYNGTITFRPVISDNDIDTIRYTINNNTKAIASTYTTDMINFRDFEAQPFNFTVWANDTFGNYTEAWVFFNFTDTVTPGITGIENKTIYVNSTHYFNVTFTDENFFSFNVTCSNGYTNNVTGLNAERYTFTGTTNFSLNTTYYCYWHFCDGHTGNELKKNWQYIKKNRTADFIIDYKKKTTIESDKNFELSIEKKKDRYTMELTPSDSEQIFTIKSEGLNFYLPSEKYLGWIVDSNTETWLDFNGYRDDLYVYDVTPNEKQIILRGHKAGQKIKLQSVGELNCRDVTQEFIAEYEPVANQGVLSIGTCPSNSIGWTSMIFAFAVIIILVWLSISLIKIPALTMILGLGVIVVGYFYYSCVEFVALMMMVTGVFIILYSFVKVAN